MIKKAIAAILMVIGVLAGIYLASVGIVLQHVTQSSYEFDQQSGAWSYLWWGVSALGLALIVVCIWGGIRFLRGRSSGAHVQ
ncbi:hypothetical protein [Mycobacteroides chelonae]|uniref:hypothetical protein n=1 Tax=Mycobacteroides chelonae TaxID=1774 RepID=UPI0008A88E2F|nr:hypothetical protein [Mycobacteroides chelonae]OHT80465.1 hypothetical protein BKG69_06020 [Mycobacteroides chelonae]